MAYTKWKPAWRDLPSKDTPVTADALNHIENGIASAAATADNAVQPDDLATVATTGDYDDLTGTPTLGTAAAMSIEEVQSALVDGGLAEDPAFTGTFVSDQIVSADADFDGLTGDTFHLLTGTHVVDANKTLTGWVSFSNDAKIQPASGVTVTLDATILAGVGHIFDLSEGGTVNVSTAKNDHHLAEWWGAVPLVDTDSAAAIAAALASIAAGGGGTLKLLSGNYKSSIDQEFTSGTKIIGAGDEATLYTYTGSGDAFVSASIGVTLVQYPEFRGFELDGSNKATADVGVNLTNVDHAVVDLLIRNFDVGVKLSDGGSGDAVARCYYNDVGGRITGCGKACVLVTGDKPNANSIHRCRMSSADDGVFVECDRGASVGPINSLYVGHCFFTNLDHAIRLQYVRSCVFSYNRFEGVDYSFYFDTTSSGANNTQAYCTFGPNHHNPDVAAWRGSPLVNTCLILEPLEGQEFPVANRFQIPGVIHAVRSIDATPVNNSTTVVSDDTLRFPIAAGEVWAFRFTMFVDGGVAGASSDFKAGVSLPGNSGVATTVVANIIGPGLSATSTSSANGANRATDGAGGAASCGLTDGDQILVELIGTVYGGDTGGYVTLQYAQATAQDSDLVLKKGSSLRAQRIA